MMISLSFQFANLQLDIKTQLNNSRTHGYPFKQGGKFLR